MPRTLRLRIALVLVVVAASVWYLFPPQKTINLGLDLQGGIHLMLGVEADKHVASQTDRAAEDLKSALESVDDEAGSTEAGDQLTLTL